MRHSRRRGLIALAIVTTGLVGLTGCVPKASSGSTASGSAGTSKGTLTLGQTADIPGWDPAVQPSYQGWGAMAVWQHLYRVDGLAKASPDLAQSLDFASDNTSLTAHLRPGQKFTDGTPVDAAAVKANFEYAAAQPNSRLAGLKVTTSGTDTVTFKLAAPDPLITVRLGEPFVVSPKSLAAGKASKQWTSPVGSGPYKIDTAATTRGSVYTFTKNPGYWDAKDFPYQKLVLRVLSNETAAINALKSGQIDGSIISANTYNQAAGSSALQVLTLKGSETTRLLITDHQGKKIKALGNLKVRQAMNMVFDRDAIAKDLYQGHASPAYQIFRPGTTAYKDGLADPYPYNVSKAKQLMADAGYSGGFTLQIPVIAGVGTEKLLPYVKQQLALINIKVQQVNLSGPNMYAELLGGKYPVPLWPLGNYGDSKQDIYDYVLDTGIWNVEHQKDPKVTALWKDIVAGKNADQAQKDINQYVIDQAWFVPMAYPDLFYAHSKRVSIPKATDFAGLQPNLWDFK
jgi:peptide/nickel transport system substrate-binding protein